MTSDQWAKIFVEQIAPMIGLNDAASQAQPKLIVVGAQPGAGKSAEIARMDALVADAVVINGDEYRAFHPDYESFLKEDTATAAERTGDAVGYWVSTALLEARSRKCNVIMETTLRQPDLLSKTLTDFVAAGYAVELRVLVVHPELSRLGVYQRYLAAAAAPGVAPRYSRRRYHDEALKNQAVTIKELEPFLGRVTLLDRQGGKIAAHAETFPDWTSVIHALRSAAISSEQMALLCDEWTAVLEKLIALAAPSEIQESAGEEMKRHCG